MLFKAQTGVSILNNVIKAQTGVSILNTVKLDIRDWYRIPRTCQ